MAVNEVARAQTELIRASDSFASSGKALEELLEAERTLKEQLDLLVFDNSKAIVTSRLKQVENQIKIMQVSK